MTSRLHRAIKEDLDRIKIDRLLARIAALEDNNYWLKTANHYKHKFESTESTNSELEARIAALEDAIGNYLGAVAERNSWAYPEPDERMRMAKAIDYTQAAMFALLKEQRE